MTIDSLDAVDVVAMAIPPAIQAELALRAAEAGRHLLLEKPLSLAVEAADRLVALVERQRLSWVVFFTFRYDAGIDAFLADSATSGGWHSARAVMYGSIFRTDHPFGASPWRRQEGGPWDIGPHALSVLLPVLGRAIDQLMHSITNGNQPHPCDVGFGREVVAILAAADTARRTGQAVPVGPEPGNPHRLVARDHLAADNRFVRASAF